MAIADRMSGWLLIGSHFYSANIKHLYWDYNIIASVYKGFSLTEIKRMTVRERKYWNGMAKWNMSSNGG